MNSLEPFKLKELQVQKYIGIPYLANGRDTKGIDCYGLVRLIYKQEYNIDLPSLAEDYHMDDNARIEELVNFYKEGWEPTENISAGDVVVFKVLGADTHVGVAISSTHFIHARSEHDSAIESFSSGRWKTRIVGSYKYKENKNENNVVLNGIPHPLRTERITTAIPPGINLIQMQDWIISQYNIEPEYKSTMHIFVNGHLIPKDMHEFTILHDNDTVEYRVIPGKNALRTVLTVAVAVAVTYATAGVAAGGLGWGASLGGALGIGATAGTALASIGLTAVGMALVDAIAPVRPPADPTNPGSSERQLMVNGGANRPTPYGSIPFVLGKVRMTPPLGANTYNLFSADGKESYLRMLLVWGYGPLYVDKSTLKIGELPISNYEGVTQETLTRITEPTSTELSIFNGLYGTDKTQVNSGVELTCDGVAGSTPTPGPWLDAVSTDGAIADFTLAVHFPQGCRKISSKGDTAGKSYASPVQLQVEYKKLSSPTWTAGGTHTVGATAVKDAFTWTKTISFSSTENVQVRIRRLTGTGFGQPTDENYQWVFTSTLVNTTFSRNAKPANDPLNCKIAKTAFEIKASDQLNGQIEGINAIVQTYAKTWNGTVWVDAVTNNPAALFRHVLEHPANPRRVTDAANKIDLVQLQYWYNYCVTKGFTYNAIVASQRSVLDVLRDIAAAGRASPAMVDGKWTVVIDEPKANVVQHFTPHNSWGFEGTKSLPKIPDGLRVSFVDEDKNYQESEEIVYATAQSASTAALIENISVPGVTKRSLAIDHARWHMAQAKLRPETYTLNTDIEYIVCNRGDRVKVMHDVPMWGLGSGRIKDIRTNLLSYSEQFDNANWSKLTSTITQNTITSPDGTLTADTIVSTGSSYYVYKNISGTGEHTLSMYMKSGTSSVGGLYITGASGGSAVAQFNLSSGVVTSVSNGTANIEFISNGWYRCSITTTRISSGNVGFYVSSSTSGDSVYIWGAQLETGSVATDYIPTTTTTNSRYYLDESLPMKANVSYTIRVRNKTGGTTVRTLVPKTSDGYYDAIELTASATTAEIDTSDLFMFGELNQESQDCVVLSIEPTGNKSARLTLVDYGVTPLANIYTDYLNYTNTLTFESQITLPPTLLIQSFGTKVPTITKFVSDETVMERIAPGVFAYKMKVSYTNAINLPATTKSVEFQYDYAAATDYLGTRSAQTAYNSGSITILNVDEGDVLKVRARYVGEDGRTGVWTAWQSHTIVGKTTAPSAVTGFGITTDNLTGKLKLAWATNTEVDIKAYEVRTDTNWGNATNLVFLGDAVNCQDTPGALASAKTYYIKALDYSGNYSPTAASASYTVARPVTYTGTVTYSYADTSTTDSTVTFNWTAAPSGVFAINTYQITLTRPGNVVTTQEITGLSWVTAANWVGDATVTIKSKDILGNLSLNASTATTITKARPAAPATITASNFTVIGSQVSLDWLDVAKVTNGLPVGGYEIRKSNSNWGVQDSDLVWRGSVSNATLKNIVAGNNTWYVNTFDTDNVYALNGTIATFTASKPDIVTSLDKRFDTTSATSGVVIFNWTAPVVTSFAVSKYRVKLTRPDSTFISEIVDSTTWTTAVDWINTATFKVTTIDAINNESATDALLNVTKVAPTAPSTFEATPNDTGLTLKWPAATKGTLPIAGYELRATGTTPGGADFIWKGTASSYETKVLTLDSNTWDLWVYDTDNRYSISAKALSYNVARPSDPRSLDGAFNTALTNATASFTWVKPSTSAFGIAKYEVSFTTTNPVRTINSTRNTTDWVIPADWLGTGTLSVTAVDNLGFSSNAVTYDLNKVVPDQPGAFLSATPSGTTVELDWPDNVKTSLPIVGYELRSADSGWGTGGFVFKGNSSHNIVDITGTTSGSTLTWYLKAYDTDRRYSNDARSYDYEVKAPVNTSVLTYKFDDTNLTAATITLNWKDTIPTFGLKQYEVTGTLSTLVTTSAASNLVTVTSPNGTKGLKVGDTITSSSTIPAGKLIASIISSTQFTLDSATGVTAGTAIITSIANYRFANATTITLPADWLGDKIFTVKTVDTLNNKSTGVQVTATKAIPNTATNFRAQIIDNNVLLYWTLPALTTLPISHARIKKGSNWTDAEVIGDKSGTFTSITELQGGAYTYWLAIVDTDNNESLPISLGATVSSPPDYIFNAEYKSNFTGGITNAVSTTDKGSGISVSGNQITGNNTPNTWQAVRGTNSFTSGKWYWETKVISNGSHPNAWMAGVSTSALLVASQYVGQTASSWGYYNLGSNLIGPNGTQVASGTTALVAGDILGLALDTAAGTLRQYKNGVLFATMTGVTGTLYPAYSTYGKQEILLANFGESKFSYQVPEGYNGFNNSIVDSQSGYLVMPVNTTETFAGHFTSNSWVGPEDPVGTAGQIDAGYTIYIQPGLTTGYYEEIFDYGSTLGSSQISVAIAKTNVAGSPDVSVTISTSLDGINYPSVYTNTTSAFGSLFRYVKVRITATQVTAGNIVSIQSIVVRLDAKQKTDSGTAVMALGAAQPQGNISHDYIDLWIPGSLPTAQFGLNGTSLENSITSAVGPGGYTQAIWNCIDSDITNDSDGGWTTSYVPATLTQGHLFAVFIKTTTNNGTSSFGLNTNSTISNLTGTTVTDPYFWAGDLPASNTWYLVTGYLHEMGYSGTTSITSGSKYVVVSLGATSLAQWQTYFSSLVSIPTVGQIITATATGTLAGGALVAPSISGVYNLTATKVADGTEFKALSGTSLMHRCYHNSNSTNSGTIVQQMARPVIIPCTRDEAPSKISYLLQCATGYGMSVTPNQQFIDVVSITATPQGTVPTTPLIDFNDIPSPRRFNIFNYNSSGTLVNGSVSWAVRGY